MYITYILNIYYIYTILYNTILYYTILYYTILYYIYIYVHYPVYILYILQYILPNIYHTIYIWYIYHIYYIYYISTYTYVCLYIYIYIIHIAGLYLSYKKTEYIFYNQTGGVLVNQKIKRLKLVDNFKYLGSWIQSSQKDMEVRIGQVCNAHKTKEELYGNLQKVTESLRVRKLRFKGHSWRRGDELESGSACMTDRERWRNPVNTVRVWSK